jgi:transposase
MDHDTRLKNAVKLVQQGTASYRQAAKKYDLSPATIWRHANGLLKPGARQGNPPMLSKAEELGVVDVVRLRSRRGICMDVDEMRYLIRQAAIAGSRFPPQGFPSRRYVARFVKRLGKVLCIKRAQVRDITRYEGSTEDRICLYFENLEMEIDGLPRDRVWNCDETGFSPRT